MSYLSFVTHSGPLVTYALTGATIFAETGLLIGFFLPGDSLLFGLGLIAANHTLNLGWIIIISSICAIIGETVGYSIGRRTGRGLFTGKKGLFNEKQLIAAEHFYERYGAATIVVARFIPVVRTFVPVVAGAAEMPYKSFMIANIFGGLLWIISITAGGYYLGHLIPHLDRDITLIMILVVIVSVLSAARHLLKQRKAH